MKNATMNTLKVNLFSCLAALSVLGACDLDGEIGESSDSEEGKSEETKGDDSGTPPDDSTAEDDDDGASSIGPDDDDDATEGDGDLLLDVGPVGEHGCHPLLQDCIDGEACYAQDGGFECDGAGTGDENDVCADGNECSPGYECVDATQLESCAGDACCTQFCDLESADCGGGLECRPWSDDPAPGYENVGTCGDPQTGSSEPCTPLLQDCPDGEGCYPSEASGFACAVHDDETGGQGAACTEQTECAVGLACVDADALADCDDARCCTAYCDTAAGDGCDLPSSCVDWASIDPDGIVPPGSEDLGACGA